MGVKRTESLIRSAVLALVLFSTGAMADLRVNPDHPYSFLDGDQPVYLIGAGWYGPPRCDAYDLEQYLDRLASDGINFTRLLPFYLGPETIRSGIALAPWLRTGPSKGAGNRLDFDLERFDPAYFNRLKQFMALAQERGIYVEFSLFEGCALKEPEDWRFHPFHKDNNVNGISADFNNDGLGFEFHTLGSPHITKMQEAYVRKVLEQLNPCPNLIWEIGNETNNSSPLKQAEAEWTAHFVEFIKQQESTLPRQHLLAVNDDYTDFDAAADPRVDVLNYHFSTWQPQRIHAMLQERTGRGKPVVFDETPPVQKDTPVADVRNALWATLTGGGHINLLDWTFAPNFGGDSRGRGGKDHRRVLKHLSEFVRQVDLARLRPCEGLSDTGFCLANPGREYVIYLPKGGALRIDWSACEEAFGIHWLDPDRGVFTIMKLTPGGKPQKFQSPFRESAVFWARAVSAPVPVLEARE